MEIKTITASIAETQADVIIVNLFQGVTKPEGATGAVDKALGGLLSDIIKREGFEGKLGNILQVHTQGKIRASKVIVAGLGPQETFDLFSLRKASSAAVRAARDSKASAVATVVHGAGAGRLSPARAAQATVEGAVIGSYRFLDYKNEADRHEIDQLQIVEFDESKAAEISAGAERGRIVSEAVNYARNLINTPANVVTPSYLANIAKGIAGESMLELTVLEQHAAEMLGMGAFTAVAKGSMEPAKFITLRYSPLIPSSRTVAIIGKGVTFDSGGLSLKTAEGMKTMKDDMSGAAAVLASMRAISEIKPEVNVLAVVAATENMPSGSAMKPGDIVRAMNGKTIEIDNTDAEGRLTLADALCYASEQGADEMLDFATLTGACVVALGRGVSGLFSNDDNLATKLLECADTSGDRLWKMPMPPDYRELFNSDVADMKNTGVREGGAITAAMFLKEFDCGKPWAHIDIAGPAFIEKDDGLCGKGGTGAGVRLILEYLCGEPRVN